MQKSVVINVQCVQISIVNLMFVSFCFEIFTSILQRVNNLNISIQSLSLFSRRKRLLCNTCNETVLSVVFHYIVCKLTLYFVTFGAGQHRAVLSMFHSLLGMAPCHHRVFAKLSPRRIPLLRPVLYISLVSCPSVRMRFQR